MRSSWGRLRALTPNRVTVVATAAVDVTGALLPLVTDLGATDLIAPLAGINAVAIMFLRGWHQWEQAIYNADALQFQVNARAEQVAQATKPSNLKLPR